MNYRAPMTFEAYRLSFQNDDQAARAAYSEMLRLSALLHQHAAQVQPPAEAKPCA